ALGEGQLHFVFVRFSGADDASVLPYRDPQHRVRRLSPFHVLDDVGIGLFDEGSHPRERLAPPISERRDSRLDQLRRRLGPFHSHFSFRSSVRPRPARAPRRTAATRFWRPGRTAADLAGSPTPPCANGSPCL